MSVTAEIIEALKQIYDPEIPVNIYDLGLIYEIKMEGSEAQIWMTLTSPNCPVAESLPIDVCRAAESVEGVSEAKVAVVWSPPWSPAKMSEAAQLELGMY
jgi:FeS assembly SUF system protein